MKIHRGKDMAEKKKKAKLESFYLKWRANSHGSVGHRNPDDSRSENATRNIYISSVSLVPMVEQGRKNISKIYSSFFPDEKRRDSFPFPPLKYQYNIHAHTQAHTHKHTHVHTHTHTEKSPHKCWL